MGFEMGPYTNFKSKYYFHLIAKKESPSEDLQNQWQFLLSEINSLSSEIRMRVHALVMMSNHFHAIVRLDNVVDKEIVQKRIQTHWPINFHFEKIKSFYEYKQIYYYVYRNPLEAGIVKKCEDYPFSSLRQLLKQNSSELFVIDQMCILASPMERLRWLNEGI